MNGLSCTRAQLANQIIAAAKAMSKKEKKRNPFVAQQLTRITAEDVYGTTESFTFKTGKFHIKCYLEADYYTYGERHTDKETTTFETMEVVYPIMGDARWSFVAAKRSYCHVAPLSDVAPRYGKGPCVTWEEKATQALAEQYGLEVAKRANVETTLTKCAVLDSEFETMQDTRTYDIAELFVKVKDEKGHEVKVAVGYAILNCGDTDPVIGIQLPLSEKKVKKNKFLTVFSAIMTLIAIAIAVVFRKGELFIGLGAWSALMQVFALIARRGGAKKTWRILAILAAVASIGLLVYVKLDWILALFS